MGSASDPTTGVIALLDDIGWFRERQGAERARVEARLGSCRVHAGQGPLWQQYPWEVLAAAEVEVAEREGGTPEQYVALVHSLARESDGLFQPSQVSAQLGKEDGEITVKLTCSAREHHIVVGPHWPDVGPVLKLVNQELRHLGTKLRFVGLANMDAFFWCCAFNRPHAIRRAIQRGLLPSDDDAYDAAMADR